MTLGNSKKRLLSPLAHVDDNGADTKKLKSSIWDDPFLSPFYYATTMESSNQQQHQATRRPSLLSPLLGLGESFLPGFTGWPSAGFPPVSPSSLQAYHYPIPSPTPAANPVVTQRLVPPYYNDAFGVGYPEPPPPARCSTRPLNRRRASTIYFQSLMNAKSTHGRTMNSFPGQHQMYYHVPHQQIEHESFLRAIAPKPVLSSSSSSSASTESPKESVASHHSSRLAAAYDQTQMVASPPMTPPKTTRHHRKANKKNSAAGQQSQHSQAKKTVLSARAPVTDIQASVSQALKSLEEEVSRQSPSSRQFPGTSE